MIPFLRELARTDIAWADGPAWGLALGAIVLVALAGGAIESKAARRNS